MAEFVDGSEDFVQEESGAASNDMSTLLLAVSLIMILVGIGLVYQELTTVYGWSPGG